MSRKNEKFYTLIRNLPVNELVNFTIKTENGKKTIYRIACALGYRVVIIPSGADDGRFYLLRVEFHK